jgi:uncharacterized protein with GYD domain
MVAEGVRAGRRVTPPQEGVHMPKYLVFGKYAPEALQAVRKAGYTSRLPQMRSVYESVGGRLEWVLFLDHGEWDFVGLAEASGDAAFAVGSMSSASGVLTRSTSYEARTADEMDAIISRAIDYTPPGGS